MTPALQRTAPSVPLLAGLRSAHLCEASSRRVPLTYRPAVRLRRPWSSLAGIPSAAVERPWPPPPAAAGAAGGRAGTGTVVEAPPAATAAGPALGRPRAVARCPVLPRAHAAVSAGWRPPPGAGGRGAGAGGGAGAAAGAGGVPGAVAGDGAEGGASFAAGTCDGGIARLARPDRAGVGA